jgi:hypothetical protein
MMTKAAAIDVRSSTAMSVIGMIAMATSLTDMPKQTTNKERANEQGKEHREVFIRGMASIRRDQVRGTQGQRSTSPPRKQTTVKTEPWWFCSCGTKIAKVGKGYQAAFRAHQEATGCKGGCGKKQVKQLTRKAK